MSASTVTSKGQITIPKEIREYLKLRTGHRLDFEIASSGTVIIRPRNRDVRELKGMVRSRRRKPASIEDMNQAIAEGFAKR